MSPKTTGLLALIALGLGAFVFLYEIEGDATRQAAVEDAKKIHSGLEATDIEAVTLTTLDGVAARFERERGRWELVLPIRARADATALDAIAHALANMPREGNVEGARDLSGFGLGDDTRQVGFEARGETLGLRIGRTTPVGGHRYVARIADDEVAYVASYRVNAFNRNLDDLRDRRVFEFEAGDVSTLRVAWPAGSDEGEIEVAMARADDGRWHLGSPLVGPADQEEVRDLLSNLAYLRAEGFVDERDAQESADLVAALEQPALRLHFTLEEGAHLERGAKIGGEVDGLRLIEAPDGRLYTIAAERLEDFPRELVAYRFKHLSSFEVSAARRVEMAFPESGDEPSDAARSTVLRVVAELGDTGWSGGEPPIDPDRASRLVRELAGLRALDIVADEMGPDELSSLGLAPPRARIRIEGGADPSGPMETLADVRIGRFDPERGVFAQRGDSPTIFLLGAQAAEDLPISAEGYRTAFEAGAGDEGEEEGAANGGDAAESIEADPLEGVALP